MWLCYIMWLCFGSPSNHKNFPSTHQMKYLRYHLSSIPSLIFLLGRLFISYRLPILGNDEFIYVSSNQCLQLFSSLIFPLFILATSSLSTKNKPVYYLHPHWHPCNSQQYRLLFELLLQFPWWLVLCILQKNLCEMKIWPVTCLFFLYSHWFSGKPWSLYGCKRPLWTFSYLFLFSGLVSTCLLKFYKIYVTETELSGAYFFTCSLISRLLHMLFFCLRNISTVSVFTLNAPWVNNPRSWILAFLDLRTSLWSENIG